MRISRISMSPEPLQGPSAYGRHFVVRVSDFSISPRSILLLFVLYFGGGAACADTNFWSRQSAGLDYWNIHTLAINPATPTTLYAGADLITGCVDAFDSCVSTDRGAIYKSTDGGVTWGVIGPTNSGVLTLTINAATPATLYAGTRAGVAKSMDGGTTWVAANNGLPAYPHVFTLVIDPTTPTTLYAGTVRGVFKSTDGGATWDATGTGFANTDVTAMAINPMTPAIVYAAGKIKNYQMETSGGGIFKSTDGGATWVAANTGLTDLFVKALVINPAMPTTLYAGTYGGGLFKSTDSGATWGATNTGLPVSQSGLIDVYALAINPVTPTTLYLGSWSHGVFKSTDGGATWVSVKAGLGEGTVILTLAITPAKRARLYAGTLIGVFQYDEGSDPTQIISDADRIFNYLEATYPQYLAPARAASVTTPMYLYTPPVYYYRHYSGANAYIATSNGMVFYLGPATGNVIFPLGAQADFLGMATKSGF